MNSVDEQKDRLARLAVRHPALRFLVLFGSRARGDATGRSDWDLGYMAGPGVDHEGLLLDVVDALGTERVDLVDLARAGAQLRFRAAGEGMLIFESEPGAFARFWLEAVDFWCDAAPILRGGYAEVLARLKR
jgi:predicted nucleotidyltransferase